MGFTTCQRGGRHMGFTTCQRGGCHMGFTTCQRGGRHMGFTTCQRAAPRRITTPAQPSGGSGRAWGFICRHARLAPSALPPLRRPPCTPHCGLRYPRCAASRCAPAARTHSHSEVGTRRRQPWVSQHPQQGMPYFFTLVYWSTRLRLVMSRELLSVSGGSRELWSVGVRGRRRGAASPTLHRPAPHLLFPPALGHGFHRTG
jgi:hypothetical protein